MFWERFYSLCVEAGIKPNSIRGQLGLSSGAMTAWKNRGVMPARSTLILIAAHFNTTVDYLLGDSDDRHPPAQQDKKKSPAEAGDMDAIEFDIVAAIQGLSDEDKRWLLGQALFLQERDRRGNPPSKK